MFCCIILLISVINTVELMDTAVKEYPVFKLPVFKKFSVNVLL